MPAVKLSELLLPVRSPELALDPTPENDVKVDADNNASGETTHSNVTAGTIVAVVVFVTLILLAALFSALRLLRKRANDEEQQDVSLQMPVYPNNNNNNNNNNRPLPPPPVRIERRAIRVQEPALPIDMPPRKVTAAPRPVISLPIRYPRQGNSLDIGDPNVSRASRLGTSSSSSSRTPYPRRQRQAEWPLRASTERTLSSDGPATPPSGSPGSSEEADVAAQTPLPQSYNGEGGRDSLEEVARSPSVIAASRPDDVFGADVQARGM